MKKNDVFTVTIEDMGEDGAGIGKTDGYTWFIKDALIGDVIQASVMKMKKNYGFARLVKILEPAPGRVEPRCPVARACGGCQLQELDYGEQLRFKERKVYNHLKRIGGMDRLFLPEDREKAAGVLDAVVMEPIIGMEDPWRYRNKAQYPVGLGKDGQLTAGFYAGRTHSLIPAPGLDCLLGCQENKELLKIILDFMKEYKIKPYDEAAHQGLVRHVLLRKGFSSGGLMVCLVINGEELPHGGELALLFLFSARLIIAQQTVNICFDRHKLLHIPAYFLVLSIELVFLCRQFAAFFFQRFHFWQFRSIQKLLHVCLYCPVQFNFRLMLRKKFPAVFCSLILFKDRAGFCIPYNGSL